MALKSNNAANPTSTSRTKRNKLASKPTGTSHRFDVSATTKGIQSATTKTLTYVNASIARACRVRAGVWRIVYASNGLKQTNEFGVREFLFIKVKITIIRRVRYSNRATQQLVALARSLARTIVVFDTRARGLLDRFFKGVCVDVVVVIVVVVCVNQQVCLWLLETSFEWMDYP